MYLIDELQGVFMLYQLQISSVEVLEAYQLELSLWGSLWMLQNSLCCISPCSLRF
jgi:hypothetical protein